MSSSPNGNRTKAFKVPFRSLNTATKKKTDKQVECENKMKEFGFQLPTFEEMKKQRRNLK